MVVLNSYFILNRLHLLKKGLWSETIQTEGEIIEVEMISVCMKVRQFSNLHTSGLVKKRLK